MQRKFLRRSLAVLLSATMVFGQAALTLAEDDVVVLEEYDDSEEVSTQATGDVSINAIDASLDMDKSSYDNGDDITGTLKIKNNNPLAVDVTITDTLPSGYAIKSKSKSSLTIAANEEESITIVYEDTDAIPTYVAKQKFNISSYFTERGVTGIKKYEVSDKKIAKVSKKGKVKVKKTGTVTITPILKTGSKSDVTATLNVEKPVPAKNVQMTAHSTKNGIELFSGITKAKPSSWTSSKTSVATVDSTTGLITAVGEGKTKITAIFGEGKDAAKYKIKIKVTGSGSSGSSTAGTSSTVESVESVETASISQNTVTVSKNVIADGETVKFIEHVAYKYSINSSGSVSSDLFTNSAVTLVGSPATSSRTIKAGETKDVDFSVQVLSQENVDSLDLVDEHGNTVGELTDDDGDGKFTGTVELSQSSRGEKSYHAVYGDGDGSVESDPTDIYFYTEIPDAEKTKASNAITNLGGVTTASAAVTAIESAGIASNNIEKLDNGSVVFTTDNGITGIWENIDSSEKGSVNSDEDTEIKAANEAEEESSSVFTESDLGEENNNGSDTEEGVVDLDDISESAENSSLDVQAGSGVLVARPFRGSQFQYDNFIEAGEKLGSVTDLQDTDADLDTFKSFESYSDILVDSHGTIDQDGNPYLVTGEIFDFNTANDEFYADYQAGRIVVCSDGNIAVGAKWFDANYESDSLSGTRIFLGTCYSSADDEIIPKTLVAKGAQAVYGYDDTVSVTYCNDTLDAVTDELANNVTPSVAYDKAVESCGGSDPDVPETDFLFEGPTGGYRITGNVTSDNGSTISNVYVNVINTEINSYTRIHATNGQFSAAVPEGTYNVEVWAYGYYMHETEGVVISETENTGNLGNIYLTVAESGSSTITGKVIDASVGNDTPLQDAIVRIRRGLNNTNGSYLADEDGNTIVILTNEDGEYEFSDLPYGYYTVEAALAGYSSGYRSIVVNEAEETVENIIITQFLTDGLLSVTLTWGETPYDLDSHLVGPTPGGTTFHTWFSDLNRYEGSTLVADLDHDDTTSYGPEKTTVRANADGIYYFFVHNYSNEALLSASGAKVWLYIGDELRGTFSIPTAACSTSDIYWNVFTYNSETDTITTVNTVTAAPATGDTGYNSYNVSDTLNSYSSDSDNGELTVTSSPENFLSEESILEKDEDYIEWTKEVEKALYGNE
ncbi:carboxypeptidase regulatory-like domain-containing protein [Lachnospiraceae bacterium C1.1]|nr:carboxypeptidase regulatory-like domain-containing protein [Lachnospiraceae bacterium C1.1]